MSVGNGNWHLNVSNGETTSQEGSMKTRSRTSAGRRSLGLALLLGACAPTSTMIEMEPMHFEVVDAPRDTRVEILDPTVLFREAGAAFAEEDYGTAAQKYVLIV